MKKKKQELIPKRKKRLYQLIVVLGIIFLLVLNYQLIQMRPEHEMITAYTARDIASQDPLISKENLTLLGIAAKGEINEKGMSTQWVVEFFYIEEKKSGNESMYRGVSVECTVNAEGENKIVSDPITDFLPPERKNETMVGSGSPIEKNLPIDSTDAVEAVESEAKVSYNIRSWFNENQGAEITTITLNGPENSKPGVVYWEIKWTKQNWLSSDPSNMRIRLDAETGNILDVHKSQ
jgi:hypothetical protein